MEREVIISGIGGQGIQLMAKVLAQAANRAGKQVMLFGIYGGMMRGGPSESTVVISDDAIEAPPLIPQTWSLLAMHPTGLPELAKKLRAGGVLCANSTLVTQVPRDDVQVISIPATKLAEQAGTIMGAGMIALGAFCAATQLVGHDAVVQAMRDSLPPHRQHLAEKNVQLLNQGAQFIHQRIGVETSSLVTGR
ncbi:MAG TPA: 2-oxoacid:acceptor oxidoreductase family protein [Candidatus Margulisiibacteriota bacterium]|nr:2-oxoacid:acceptor oxidoreductase family protein [Candidatus Margulisiibacteriota bacterium]